MKLVFFNDFRLRVIRDGQIVDATDSFGGREFRRPQDMKEELIIDWDHQKAKIESAIQGKDGVPLDRVRLRPPLPRPGKLICAAVNYLEFGQREPSILDAFLKSPNAVIGNGETCELPP